MAGQKPNTFTVASSFPSAMEYYLQDSSNDEYRVPHALLEGKLEDSGFQKQPGAVTKTNNQTIAVAAGTLITALVITPSTNMNVSVGTSSGGTQLVDTEAVTSATPKVFVINQFFATSATLYFTLSSAGSTSVSVLLRKG
jgi:hypothetical protein